MRSKIENIVRARFCQQPPALHIGLVLRPAATRCAAEFVRALPAATRSWQKQCRFAGRDFSRIMASEFRRDSLMEFIGLSPTHK